MSDNRNSRWVLVPAALVIVVVLFVQTLWAEKALPRLVITHVTVIDTRTGQLLVDRNVIIQGDRIVSVDPATSAFSGSDVLINGRGKYVIPGLWDCHVHLSWTTESALPLFTALGITEVRDLGGKLSRD